MKQRMNGGQALVRSLSEQGVSITFGVPGAGQYEAIDATSTPKESATFLAEMSSLQHIWLMALPALPTGLQVH